MGRQVKDHFAKWRLSRNKNVPTLEGFVYFLARRSDSKQMKYLKYGLVRLAREHPEEDPRKVIAEFFMIHVNNYEKWLRDMNGG